jgi:hypothetical protein
VLEGLTEVPWAALTHAYGPADDVPGLLRGLRASDPAVAEQALKDLYASVTHQGTRYPATAPTVRFLAELAAAPDTPNRRHLLLLAYAAVGTDWPSLPTASTRGGWATSPAGLLGRAASDRRSQARDGGADRDRLGPLARAGHRAAGWGATPRPARRGAGGTRGRTHPR